MFTVYHGGARDDEKELIDFSQSVNPYYPKFLKKYLKEAEINRYPYCEEKYENMIREKLKLDELEVTLGAGVTELLYMTFYMIKNYEEVVLLSHTYSENKRLSYLFNKKPLFIEKLVPTFEDFENFGLRRRAVYFIVNPDNPTGIYYGFLRALAEELNVLDSLLVIDESFLPFTEHRNEYIKMENVIALRSFTKAFGIPGIRVGFAYGPKDKILKMKEFRMPWSIGAYGCAALKGILLEGDNFLNVTLKKVEKERDRISKKLKLKTDANFFLAKVPDSKKLIKELREKGILVRDCQSFGLENAIRFSVRKRNENNMLLKALENVEIASPF
ncbi:MAG: aminotransferase class I/II-fold pyridoxal phosphate-dependent enzyme [Nitrososphaeria archaeon]|jgi:histidinol-phosphate aminotransferase